MSSKKLEYSKISARLLEIADYYKDVKGINNKAYTHLAMQKLINKFKDLDEEGG